MFISNFINSKITELFIKIYNNIDFKHNGNIIVFRKIGKELKFTIK